MPIVITTPTCKPGDECDALINLIKMGSPDLHKVNAELAIIVQIAFEAGMEVSQPKTQPAAAQPVIAKGGNVPPYRTDYDLINEDGPANAAERFILNDMPNPDAAGVNVEGWKARFHEALKFAAKN